MASNIEELSDKQLQAYNQADLESFCACYHPEVTVLGEDGQVLKQGMSDFKEGYRQMFARFDQVKAKVSQRIRLDRHVVEFEEWSRFDPESDQQHSGQVMVRYSEEEGLIRWVQFFHTVQNAS